MKFQHWTLIRITLIAYAFISQILTPSRPHTDTSVTWPEVGLVFVLIPVLFSLGIGLLILIRGAKKFEYNPPAWNANPLNFSHPEQFFHLAAWFMFASGIANVIQGVVQSATIDLLAMLPVAAGTGMWGALRGLTAIYHRQQETSDEHA
jgi:hypothetical protein